MSWKIIHGDNKDVLNTLADNSIDSIVTDPPAGIAFMGKDWDDFGSVTETTVDPEKNNKGILPHYGRGGRNKDVIAYQQRAKQAFVAEMTTIFSECLRVLKPGGHALVWALPRTSHWTAWALDEAGFEVRDVVLHVFGSGFPKSLNVSKAIDKEAGAERAVVGKYIPPDGKERKAKRGQTVSMGEPNDQDWNTPITAPATDAAKQWDGWGTALKPAAEHWILCRKPLSEPTIAANVLKWGTGAINIDGCRVGDFQNNTPSGVNRRNAKLCEMGYRPGTYQMDEKVPNTPAGRWPANFTHDGSDEVLSCFPQTKSPVPYQRKLHGANTEMVYGGGWKDYGPDFANGFGDSGSASRFFYCAKASQSDKNEGLEGFDEKPSYMVESGSKTSGLNGKRYERKTTHKNNHPTVKSTSLMQWLCRMITPPGGTILDPFAGSGSTGKAAVIEGFDFIGIERELEYVRLAEARVAHAAGDTGKEAKGSEDDTCSPEKDLDMFDI